MSNLFDDEVSPETKKSRGFKLVLIEDSVFPDLVYFAKSRSKDRIITFNYDRPYDTAEAIHITKEFPAYNTVKNKCDIVLKKHGIKPVFKSTWFLKKHGPFIAKLLQEAEVKFS